MAKHPEREQSAKHKAQQESTKASSKKGAKQKR